jgi:hypothetical protein
MDTEKDIEMAAVKLMMDTKLPKIEVLKMILGRYQSQRRLAGFIDCYLYSFLPTFI